MTSPSQPSTILTDAEVAQRIFLLSELHGVLHDRGVRCVLATRQLIVLSGSETRPQPHGPTNPALHVFTARQTVHVTTDGATYDLPGGTQLSVLDPAAAADAIVSASSAAPPS